MDRPTPGHRRHDAGSITVVDLIRRQQGPVRIPSADEMATIQFVDDLLGPTEPGDTGGRRGWLAKGAKLAGLAFGSLLLCGSVYAASTYAQQRPDPASGNSDSAVLTGVGALLPNAVAAQLSAGPTTTKAPAHLPTPTHPVAAGRAAGALAGQATTPATTPAHATPAAPQGLVSAADVVRAFYRLVASDPSLAATMLAPSLLHGDTSGFDDAWSGLGDVQIDSIEQTAKHTVQAVIRIPEPDGSWLRVVELLHVTDGDTPLINGAQLLSAQRG